MTVLRAARRLVTGVVAFFASDALLTLGVLLALAAAWFVVHGAPFAAAGFVLALVIAVLLAGDVLIASRRR